MLDDRSARRLAEMGVDTYLLRERLAAHATGPAPQSSGHADHGWCAALRSREVSVTIVADAARGATERPLADLRRALRMAGVTSVVATHLAATTTGPAIVFGETPAATNAPADVRTDQVVAANWAHLRRDPAAKKVLWHDVVVLLRGLAGDAAGQRGG